MCITAHVAVGGQSVQTMRTLAKFGGVNSGTTGISRAPLADRDEGQL
ncbi:hypothetical protein BIW11_03365 [Tropilaelaps mercedesae]|uniref:Uncharacterized protein n=1 Tax=Tropilaelaps mercedesae TaxID=418985 RepID=A0A1V9XMM8_9ACAR|nr:hypothetical protein BIW11_03365 [Tropilaelaps mercedesae]